LSLNKESLNEESLNGWPPGHNMLLSEIQGPCLTFAKRLGFSAGKEMTEFKKLNATMQIPWSAKLPNVLRI
jgi:hypothetical protein